MGQMYFGISLTLIAYSIGAILKSRFKSNVFNPILIGMVICLAVILGFKIDYDFYYGSAKYISFFLTPATVCLGVSLYEQLSVLKKEWKAIILGTLSGCLASLFTILGLCVVFGLNHEQYVTLLPKSVTTAIGIGIINELGGIESIGVPVIIITGILGNLFGEGFLKLMRIRNPIAKGIALGSASHAIGTTKAIELGEVEGAMSSLSICVCGLFTVVLASVFAMAF